MRICFDQDTHHLHVPLRVAIYSHIVVYHIEFPAFHYFVLNVHMKTVKSFEQKFRETEGHNKFLHLYKQFVRLIYQKEISTPHHWSEASHRIYTYSETLVTLKAGGGN